MKGGKIVVAGVDNHEERLDRTVAAANEAGGRRIAASAIPRREGRAGDGRLEVRNSGSWPHRIPGQRRRGSTIIANPCDGLTN